MIDSLGDRMKRKYERRAEFYLPRRTYTVARIDGRSFHTWTKQNGLQVPFDADFAEDLDVTASEVMRQFQGSFLAYVQSDEISIASADVAEKDSDAWFDGSVQKLASVLASTATAVFNEQRYCRNQAAVPATFDARVFTISDPVEVSNYFVWRQQDAIRNAISSLAASLFSPKQLDGVSTQGRIELLSSKGIKLEYLDKRFRFGRFFCNNHPSCSIKVDSEMLMEDIPEFGYGD